MQVDIQTNGSGHRTILKIDGEQVKRCRALQLDISVDAAPRLSLDLIPHNINVSGGMNVYIDIPKGYEVRPDGRLTRKKEEE